MQNCIEEKRAGWAGLTSLSVRLRQNLQRFNEPGLPTLTHPRQPLGIQVGAPHYSGLGLGGGNPGFAVCLLAAGWRRVEGSCAMAFISRRGRAATVDELSSPPRCDVSCAEALQSKRGLCLHSSPLL